MRSMANQFQAINDKHPPHTGFQTSFHVRCSGFHIDGPSNVLSSQDAVEQLQ